MNIFFDKFLIKIVIVISLLIYGKNLEAASFDCNKASTKIEKMICSSETASQYDEELGQYYKEALLKYPDRKEMLIRQQRNWIKWIRNSCSDPSCLATLYSARLWEVRRAVDVPGLDGTEKPNFIVVEGNGDHLCDEYVKILNRTPRNELKACKLPDLTGSSIQPVEFKPLVGEDLKAIDKIIYEKQGTRFRNDWNQKWTEREKEYLMGYSQLGEASWDLDVDNQSDKIIRGRYPSRVCISKKGGGALEMSEKVEEEWDLYDNEKKIDFSKYFGFKYFFKTIKHEDVYSVDANDFILYKGKYYSVDQSQLTSIDTTNSWADKTWVEIWAIDPKRDDKNRSYHMGNSLCKFWFSN